MKKLIPLLAFIIFGASPALFASHDLGSEISYLQTASNSYQVTYKHYRDCAGVNAPLTIDLNVKAPGCNTGRNVTLSQLSRKSVNPFGPSVNANCSGTSPFSLYEVVTYTGKVTFSAAEYACPDWVLSVVSGGPTPARNILGTSGNGRYTEAHLKLQNNLVNSSPEFDTINAPLMYVNKFQDHVLSMAAQDPDGDSLVYTLVTPLEGPNQSVIYDTIGGGPNGIIINPNPLPPFNTIPAGNPNSNPQIAINAIVMINFSATYPMFSYHVNWVPGQQVVFYAPYFTLDSQNGEIKFNTSVYYDSAAFWMNRYLVSINVDEYRKINGVVVKVGSVRRETLIQVIDGGANVNPNVTSRMANTQPIASGSEILLSPGTPLNLQIAASDANTSDAVIVTTNATGILTGATFTTTNGNAPTATIAWTPTTTNVREQPYYFQVQLRDNANPLRGVHTETFAVRVSNATGVTGIKNAFTSNANFTAYPNPFTDQVTFRFNQQSKAESIIIYNLLGRQVDQITISRTASGEQNMQWQNAGKHAAGMYVAKLVSAGKAIQTLKFTKLQ
ncbi:T9SS type A sorting domain-containing protein [Adhaeribacter terreus]|uniref:T9SS type A sorting domain-containing protein n=1 Tax=Adhaeribacter terreus TaxID=529703 RepID=A0ABW0EGS5_9BACT